MRGWPLIVLAFVAGPAAAVAATLRAPAAPGAAAAALAGAAAGDTVLLGPGTHAGPLVVDRPLTLRGEPGAVVDGGGRGSVITVAAAGAQVEDLAVRGSGARALTVDAGLHARLAPGAVVRRVRFTDVLYGVYGERSDRLVVADCTLTGRVAPGDETGAGNGIHLWNSADVRVVRDTVSGFLDGVYLSFANRVHVEGGVFEHMGRYGLHTMYCQDGRIVGSRFRRNVAGCAIMFSNGLRLERNEFAHNRGARTYGVLLRDCSAGEFVGNRLVDNTIAMFMDNSNRNRVRDNLVQDNGWGVLLFSSCAKNVFAGNAFVNNDHPVALDMRRTDNRFDDGERGNYWDGSAPYDLDGDGVSDIPHSPVSAFAFVSKQVPDLAILARSPAVLALGVAERVIPALRPSQAVDERPMVAPPALAGLAPAPERDRRRRPAGAAAVGFAALALAGLGGLARGVPRHVARTGRRP